MAPQLLLRSISLDRSRPLPDGFPFSVPAIHSLDRLAFSQPVTFLVGENGCGKSTLLEGLAGAIGSITVGSANVQTDRSLDPVRPLANALKLTWSLKTRRGFFMRSEDFFGYARKLAETSDELAGDLRAADEEYASRSPTAQVFGRLAYQNELAALKHDYGEDGLDARSHGESYLHLFQKRFVPKGLYLLDEPEAPLSPLRQLTFLALLHGMVAQNAQFIIATHSPILMAFPQAAILLFDQGQIRPVQYDEVEHVYITRSFLQDPQRYLRHLFEEK